MKIALNISPDKIIRQYNLSALASNGWVYMEIHKGMPGLKQAGRIVNERLQLHLSKFGYAPVAFMPYFCKPATKNIIFCLSLTTSASNMWARTAPIIWYKHYKSSTLSSSIGTTLYNAASPSHGTTASVCATSQRPDTSLRPCTNPSTPPPCCQDPPVHGKIQFTAQSSSTPTAPMTPPPRLPPKAINRVHQIINTLL